MESSDLPHGWQASSGGQGTEPSTNEERIEAIIYHRSREDYHKKKQVAYREELKNLMEAQGLDSTKTSAGHTAYIGKATDEYSVAWRAIPQERKSALMSWAHGLGMEESVNAASFSAFVRALVKEGSVTQASLPEEVKHYTLQKLNVRESKNG